MKEIKFLDVNMVSKYTTLSKSTIYKKVDKKTIPHIKIGTRTVFDKDEIDDWMNRGGRMDDLPSLPKL